MKKFACGIVTFFPDTQVMKRIEEYSEVFNKVYVYDNTPRKEQSFNQIKNNSNILIYANGKNDGLSKAYNFFINNTLGNFEFLCTMDQDSKFDKCNIISIVDYINRNDMSKVAIIGPKIEYRDSHNIIKKNEILSKRYLISSGSFLNLPLLELADISFDSNYFIDRVDADLCAQCLDNGYRVLEYSGSILYQTLGQRTTFSKIGNHTYKRHYYIFRNRFYFNRKFISNKYKRIIVDFMQSTKHCLCILLFESQKFKKIKQIIFALKDYRQNNMGRGRY